MAWTLTQQKTVAEASQASVAFSGLTAITSGSLIVIAITESAGSTAAFPNSVTVGTGSNAGFQVFSANTQTDGPTPEDWISGNNSYTALVYCLSNSCGGSTSITVGMSATKTCGGVLFEFAPPASTTVSADGSKHGGGGTASTNQPCPAVTTTGTDLVVVGAIRAPSATVSVSQTNSTPTSGWNGATSMPATTAGVAYQIFTATQTSPHAGFANTTSSVWGAVSMGFKAVASGGGGAATQMLPMLGVGS